MTAQPGGKEQILASVLRTFEVAELLAREGEMGVTRIAREIGLDKSSVYRILATLKSIGYVCRNPATQGYSNTNRFSSLCGGFLQAERRDFSGWQGGGTRAVPGAPCIACDGLS